MGKLFKEHGFNSTDKKYYLGISKPDSQLKIQIIKDERYLDFPSRAQKRHVLGLEMPVASLDDIVRAKIWAYQDPDRKLEKKEKDRLDLIRIALSHTKYTKALPENIRTEVTKEIEKRKQEQNSISP